MASCFWLNSGNRNVISPANNHILLSPAASRSCSATIRDHAVPQLWKPRGLSSNWGSHNQAALCPEKTKDTSSRSSMHELSHVALDTERLVQKLQALSSCGELSSMEMERVQNPALSSTHDFTLFLAHPLWISHRSTMAYASYKMLLSWHENSKL